MTSLDIRSSSCSLGSLLPDIDLNEALAKVKISGICLDSRLVGPGDLFFAVPGFSKDGRDYILSSLQSGAEVVLCHSDNYYSLENKKVVPITNLNKKISEISGRFYSNPSRKMSLTGITGTNGKTTCTQLLAEIFSAVDGSAGIIGTLGYGCITAKNRVLKDKGMTTPDPVTIQAVLASFVDSNIDRVVMEVSSHSISQSRVKSLLFDTAIFTNLSHDHLDYHGDLTSYSIIKKEFFFMPGLKNAVVNEDDPVGLEIAKELPLSVNKISFSLVNPKATIYADRIDLSISGITARVKTPWGRSQLKSKLIGKFNLLNLLAVIGAACSQGLDFLKVIKLLSLLESIPGRMEIIPNLIDKGYEKYSDPKVIVDFAHTPDALENVLETLRGYCSGKLWCVFGCGGERDKEKRPKMGKIANQLADYIIVTNDNPREENPEIIAKEIFSGIAITESMGASVAKIIFDRREAINFAIKSAGQGDIVLIAGKGHELYQFIGSQKLSFSDKTESRMALKNREMQA